MTKWRVAAVVFLLAVIASDVFAVDLAQWEYKAQVTIEDTRTGYCKLMLTPDIYNAAKSDLGDIRLIGPSGEQVPYILTRPKDITEKVKYRPLLINRSTNETGAALVTLDLRKKVMKNSVDVETAGNSFRRAVKVEGSNDNVKFFTLVAQAYVFAIGDEENSRFSKVDLPVNDYRYLRITVEPMAGEEKSPIIKQAGAFKIEKSLAQRQLTRMSQAEHTEDEKNTTSIYTYDLSYRNLPITEVELDVADNSFYRYVTLHGRDQAVRKVKLDSEDNRQRFREVEVGWQRIVSDTIYRYTDADGKKRENLLLRTQGNRHAYRYLKITVKNYDDNPIVINSVSAKMLPHRIVFPVEADHAAPTLYVGAESASRPRYDLARTLKHPLSVEAAVGNLSSIVDNPLFGQTKAEKLAWTEKHKILLLVVLVMLVLVMGAFILTSFKSIRGEQIHK
jgi:hypothetical protein